MADDLLDQILESPRLPSLPAIALEVIGLVQQPDVGIDQLAATIENDPAIASRVLQSANSSFYAQSRKISTLSEAVMVLGLSTVRTLALGFSLVDDLRGRAESGFDYVQFWRRSLLAGVTARAIAKEQRAAHPEEAFLGGLLHGLGVLALVQVLGESYGSIFVAADGRYDRLRELELERLELDHAQVGSALALRWNLPPQLTGCLAFYAEPESAEESMRPLLRCVSLGSHGADVMVGVSPGEALAAYRGGMQRYFGTDEGAAEALLTQAADEAGELRRVFELPEQSESASTILGRANAALLQISLQETQRRSELELENAIFEQAHAELLSISLQESQHGSELEAQNRELAAAAKTDPLTGLANRRQLEEFLQQQCAGARRQGTPLAVMMVDIDHFKRVNDQHGHQAGDLVLVAVAGAIAATARESDLVSRYGGEEFAVVMPLAVLTGAIEAAERIRRAIERLTTELAGGAAVRVTASFGVSPFGAGCDTPETLIEAADAALYEAKESGRNRVCASDAQADAA